MILQILTIFPEFHVLRHKNNPISKLQKKKKFFVKLYISIIKCQLHTCIFKKKTFVSKFDHFFPLNFKKIYIKPVCCWIKNYFTTKRNYLYGHEKDLENIKCPISANDFHINKYIKNLFYMHFMVNMIKYGRWIVFCFIQEVFQETSYDCYSSVLCFHKTLFLRSKWHQMNMIMYWPKKEKKRT
jgi:hypothetical protein